MDVPNMQEAEQLLENTLSESQEQSPAEPEVTPGQDETPEAELDSFTGLDPNTIPEELQPWYKSMQADYVRKTQALAEQRKAIEGLGDVDPTLAVEAVQFVTKLQSDPQFALEVHRGLSTALQEAGLSVDEANQAATQAISDAQNDPSSFMEDEPDPRDAQLQELLAWKEEQESRQFEMEIANNLQRQENILRQQYPDYTDEDIEYIYSLAFAHNGDLMAANDSFINMRNAFISRYYGEKKTVPSSTPGPTPHAQQPARFEDEEGNPSLDQADKAAREFFRNQHPDFNL